MESRIEPSRDLFARLKKSASAYQVAPQTEEEQPMSMPPKSVSLTFHGPSTATNFESLSVRRRKFILSQPVKNRSVLRLFYLARCRLKGVLLWKRILNEIQIYGTTSNILDIYQAYKKNLESVMHAKQRKPKDQTTELVDLGWLIDPDSRLKQLWNVLILLLLLYSFTVVPFVIAFDNMDPGSMWYYVDIATNALFSIDIVLTFNTALLDANGKLIVNRKTIITNYATGMLTIDILSVFPFFAFDTGGGSNNSNAFLRFLRLSRFTRLFRTSKLITVIKYFSRSKSMEKCLNFIRVYSGVARLIGALNVVCIIVHFVACMWYYMARMNDFSSDTWVVRNNLQDSSSGMLYLTSVYWAVTTLTTVGYGDVVPFTDSETILCMVWMMFGVGFYSFVVGTLSSVLTSMDTKSVLLNSKMQLVDLFAKDTKLPKDLLKEMHKELKKSAGAVTLDESQRQSLLMHLPKGLKYDISMTMYEGAASNIAFFVQQDKAFAANIIPLLGHVVKGGRELVYAKGDYADEMYFITAGRVNFVYNGYLFKTIVTGSYFGEIELMEQRPRDFSVLTEDHCELFIMNKTVFLIQLFDAVFAEYPKVAEKLANIASIRKTKNLRALQELADVLEAVEIRKETTYEDLAGKACLTDDQRSENRSSAGEESAELASKLQIEEMREECKRLQGAVTDIQKAAGQILSYLGKLPTSEKPRAGFKLPPIVP